MPDKKGSLLHWTLFGFLIALGIIFFISPPDMEAKEKGQWQLTFLKENYLEAGKELLKLDIIARKLGREIAAEFAEKGGYLQASPCGSFNKLPLWNKGSKSCFPQVKEEAAELAQMKLKEELEREFEELSFRENFFLGKGGRKTISSKVGDYTYDYAFLVDLGYSFDEYQELEEKSRGLILRCNPETDLKKCLSVLPEKWHIGSCRERKEAPAGREIPFCVESASAAGMEYKFALDFT